MSLMHGCGVVLVACVGPLVVLAQVSTVSASVSRRPLRVGESVRGEISPDAPHASSPGMAAVIGGDSMPCERFRLELGATERCTLTVRSFDFDVYLVVRDAADQVVVEDDNGWVGTQAQATFALADGEPPFTVDVCDCDAGGGQFELACEAGAPAAMTSRERWTAAAEEAIPAIDQLTAQRGA